jgi:MoxR-like ATPase
MTHPAIPTTEAELELLLGRLAALRGEIGKVIVGQQETVEHLLVGLLAGGHCLLEGVPGLAKTLMVRTLGDALELTFKRIQFTPDLMPSDIVGTEILEEDHGTGRRVFRFAQGPVFTNLLLADEINRSPPKTQAALLEAMQERAVTFGGQTHPLPRPFFVLATQNPIEQEGTYPLPEAQLDRFLLHLRIGYPSAEEEVAILAGTTGERQAAATAVLGASDVLLAQELVRQVHVAPALLTWVVELVRATRPATSTDPRVRDTVDWGAGPRAGQSLVLAAKGRALLAGRLAATLDDLRAVARPVLRHRILVGFRGQAEGVTADSLVDHLLSHMPPPKSPLE